MNDEGTVLHQVANGRLIGIKDFGSDGMLIFCRLKTGTTEIDTKMLLSSQAADKLGWLLWDRQTQKFEHEGLRKAMQEAVNVTTGTAGGSFQTFKTGADEMKKPVDIDVPRKGRQKRRGKR